MFHPSISISCGTAYTASGMANEINLNPESLHTICNPFMAGFTVSTLSAHEQQQLKQFIRKNSYIQANSLDDAFKNCDLYLSQNGSFGHTATPMFKQNNDGSVTCDQQYTFNAQSIVSNANIKFKAHTLGGTPKPRKAAPAEITPPVNPIPQKAPERLETMVVHLEESHSVEDGSINEGLYEGMDLKIRINGTEERVVTVKDNQFAVDEVPTNTKVEILGLADDA